MTVLSLQWDFLDRYDDIFILNQGPDDHRIFGAEAGRYWESLANIMTADALPMERA